eukprot:sb/3479177/
MPFLSVFDTFPLKFHPSGHLLTCHFLERFFSLTRIICIMYPQCCISLPGPKIKSRNVLIKVKTFCRQQDSNLYHVYESTKKSTLDFFSRFYAKKS